MPDSMEENLLTDFRPAWAQGVSDHGDVVAARALMALSPYDTDHDGRCDAKACRNLSAAAPADPRAGNVIERDLKTIGLELSPRTNLTFRPSAHVPFSMFDGFATDYPNGTGYLPLLFSVSQFGLPAGVGHDFSLLGASPSQLRKWGYGVRQVPSVDVRLHACVPLTGLVQSRCWADVDELLMEQAVPWVPYEFAETREMVSPRVASYSFDQFTSLPALDRIALKPGSD
jgi:hypothetical protein